MNIFTWPSLYCFDAVGWVHEGQSVLKLCELLSMTTVYQCTDINKATWLA